MKIAIIGAGLSGLATAKFLVDGGAEVLLYDKGGSASRVATGLMHPYPGRQCRKSWMADEAIAEAKALLAFAGVSCTEGVVRVAISDEQRQALECYDDVEALGDGRYLIQSGVTVDVPLYLDRLQEKLGLEIQEEMQECDITVIAAGAGSDQLVDLDLKKTKGQVLICKGEVQQGIIKKGYMAPCGDGTFQFGSTYEHDYESVMPDVEEAKRRLEKKYFHSEPMQVVGCKAGVRVAQKGDYKPLLKQIDEKTWVLTAMGSRGLLYHAYFGKLLSERILSPC